METIENLEAQGVVRKYGTRVKRINICFWSTVIYCVVLGFMSVYYESRTVKGIIIPLLMLFGVVSFIFFLVRQYEWVPVKRLFIFVKNKKSFLEYDPSRRFEISGAWMIYNDVRKIKFDFETEQSALLKIDIAGKEQIVRCIFKATGRFDEKAINKICEKYVIAFEDGDVCLRNIHDILLEKLVSFYEIQKDPISVFVKELRVPKRFISKHLKDFMKRSCANEGIVLNEEETLIELSFVDSIVH